jgi:hypothetical protein
MNKPNKVERRLKQLEFKKEGSTEEERTSTEKLKDLETNSMKAGYALRRDAKGVAPICWCTGHWCDAWDEERRIWGKINLVQVHRILTLTSECVQLLFTWDPWMVQPARKPAIETELESSDDILLALI